LGFLFLLGLSPDYPLSLRFKEFLPFYFCRIELNNSINYKLYTVGANEKEVKKTLFIM